jgi:hypothetical protein
MAQAPPTDPVVISQVDQVVVNLTKDADSGLVPASSPVMRLRILFTCSVIALLFFSPAAVEAQSPIVVTSETHEVNFPNNMRFAIQTESTAQITILRLTVWQNGVALGSRHTPRFQPGNQVRALFEWNFQAFGEGGYLPPGTRGEYTWHIEDEAGNTFDTPRQPYFVEDTSQTWNSLSNEDLRVSWHSGDQGFGQAIFGRAISAHAFLENELGINNTERLEIYIYADKQEFFNSLPAFSAEWTGGRMFPEFGVIMINFAPNQLEWGLRATSHELSHAILHAKIRGTIGQLSIPHWLDEGLAVYNETDDHIPDPEFEKAFQPALRRNALIPLRTMQLQFPNASEQAQLAYGISYSVVRFMVEEYGKEKFSELLNIYEIGASSDEGLERVYGMNQDELENAWRSKLGAPLREFTRSRLPTIQVRPTYDISAPFSNNVTVTPSPTLEPTRVSVVATAVPANSTRTQSPSLLPTTLCGGLFAMLGLVGLSRLLRKKL